MKKQRHGHSKDEPRQSYQILVNLEKVPSSGYFFGEFELVLTDGSDTINFSAWGTKSFDGLVNLIDRLHFDVHSLHDDVRFAFVEGEEYNKGYRKSKSLKLKKKGE